MDMHRIIIIYLSLFTKWYYNKNLNVPPLLVCMIFVTFYIHHIFMLRIHKLEKELFTLCIIQIGVTCDILREQI